MIEIHKIIFFDGHCNFCNSTINFFFSKNKKRNIFYSSLQSEFAQSFLPRKYIAKEEFNTIYYYSDGIFYSKSTAVLKALKEVKGGYKLLSLLRVIPTFIRDYVYDFISKRRHDIFKNINSCRVPSDEDKKYFLKKSLDLTKYNLH